MARYVIWNKETDVVTPIGEVLKPEQWKNRYPFTALEKAVPVVADGFFNGGFCGELSQMKANCEKQGAIFDDGLTAEELLAAIEAWEDALAIASTGFVSDETRMADALEDMVVLQEIAALGE
jgi:hypothetical protein